MHHGGRTADKGPSASPPLNEDYLSMYKRRKITHACDYCRIKRTKCDSLKPQCSQCAKANVACTFLIRHKKRGPIPRDPYELRRVSDGDLGRDQGPGQSINTEPVDRPPIIHTNSAARDDVKLLAKGQTVQTLLQDPISESSPLEIIPASPPLRQYSIQEDTPSKEVSDHLIQIFFLYCYQDFEFLDPQSFLDEYSRGTVSPILLNSMFAVAARFSDHPQVAKFPQYLSGEPFAKYVRDRIIELIDEASLDHLHALLLVSFFEYTASRGARGWRFEGLACRMSLELLLHLQTTVPRSEADRVAFEVKYRSFYSVVLSDIISAANAGMPPVLMPKHYKFNIPESDIDWWVNRQPRQLSEENESYWEEVDRGEAISPALQDYYREGILRRLREPGRFRGYGPARYVFRLAEILSRVSGYINGYTLDSDKRPSDPDSEFSILNDDLSSWLESVPPELSPSGSPGKGLSFSSNSTFMALTFYMTVVLLHRPILALEELVDATFHHRSSIQCTDVATKASQIIEQFDAETIKYRGHTFAYAVFTTATIHVTNAFSPDEQLARSAKRCLNHHLNFMKEANPYCAMAGRFYYVIQDLYSMQSKLHAYVTPPVSQSARHVNTIDSMDDGHVAGDRVHEMDSNTDLLSTPNLPCPVSPIWSSSGAPSISSTLSSSGRSRVLPVSSLLRSDSGLVGLWKRVNEMQALDTTAHSLRQLSLKSPHHFASSISTEVSRVVTSATSSTVDEPVELRKDIDIAISSDGPTMEDVASLKIMGLDVIESSASKGSVNPTFPSALNNSHRTIKISARQDSNVIMSDRSTLSGNAPQEIIDKKNSHVGEARTTQGGTSDITERSDPYPVGKARTSTTVEGGVMDAMDSVQCDLVLNDKFDHGPSTCLLPSALPMNKPGPNAAAEISLREKSPRNEVTDTVANAGAAFQEVAKSSGERLGGDLRRRPYPPDRKPNRGGQGRPSQVRGRHHQHHEGPRSDLGDNRQSYMPLGFSERGRIADTDLGLPPEGKQWSNKLGMIFQYQHQVMSTRFQHATSHSPEPRCAAFPAQTLVSSQSPGLVLDTDSAAMTVPPRSERDENRSHRRESAPARDSLRSPPSPTWHQGDQMSRSTKMHIQQLDLGHHSGHYRHHAESGGNSSFDPFLNLPVNRTRSLEHDDNISANTSTLKQNIKSSSYSPPDHRPVRVHPNSSRGFNERQHQDEHEQYHGPLWEQEAAESRGGLERSSAVSSRLERLGRIYESPTRNYQQLQGDLYAQDGERAFALPPPPLQIIRSIPLPPPLPSFQMSRNFALDTPTPESYRRWSPSGEPVSPSPAMMIMSDQNASGQQYSNQRRFSQHYQQPSGHEEHEEHDSRGRLHPPQHHHPQHHHENGYQQQHSHRHQYLSHPEPPLQPPQRPRLWSHLQPQPQPPTEGK